MGLIPLVKSKRTFHFHICFFFFFLNSMLFTFGYKYLYCQALPGSQVSPILDKCFFSLKQSAILVIQLRRQFQSFKFFFPDYGRARVTRV